MKHESGSDFERDGRSETAHAWTGACHVAHAEPKPQALSVRWPRGGKARFVREAPMPLAIRADHGALDERCQATVRKLISAGCTRAGQPYSIEQFQVGERELEHLERHGLVHAEASALLQPVIRSCEKVHSGADVGKINIVLNVNLY